MTDLPALEKTLFTRKEASRYLTEIGRSITHNGIYYKMRRNEFPTPQEFMNQKVWTREQLDEWAGIPKHSGGRTGFGENNTTPASFYHDKLASKVAKSQIIVHYETSMDDKTVSKAVVKSSPTPRRTGYYTLTFANGDTEIVFNNARLSIIKI
jgi:hypothetical protein